jgi:hypothetical protein
VPQVQRTKIGKEGLVHEVLVNTEVVGIWLVTRCLLIRDPIELI